MTREEAIARIKDHIEIHGYHERTAVKIFEALDMAIKALEQPKSTRTFVELIVTYPDPQLCAYKVYKGKPYYSIKYIENGEEHVGYGTYNPAVLSQCLKEYFMPFAQSDVTQCKDCRYQEESETIGGGRFILGIDTPEGSSTYYPWMLANRVLEGERRNGEPKACSLAEVKEDTK